MKKLILSVLVIFLMANVVSAKDKKYGATLTLKEKTKISDIYANPQKYVGKKVLVEGMLLDVCAKRGCWVELSSDKEFQKIRVKVNDGEIIFPMEAKGKTGLFEGMIQEIKLTKEQAIERAEHHAEEQGTKFDPSTITEGTTLYQIKGLGAVIKD
ncbi:MAG: DUF4920 domain-containing protein [Ignavibacteria bacterium]|nr:DUF4920 domain-containing protein [Ignavibacteria bacterium]